MQGVRPSPTQIFVGKAIRYVLLIPFFVSGFWSLLVTQLQKYKNLCLHFARQDGQDGKNRKENHETKVTKIPKTKGRKYGMNETFKTYS